MNILITNFHRHYGGGHDTYIKYLATLPNANIYVACPKTSHLYSDLKTLLENQRCPNLKGVYPVEFGSTLSKLGTLFKSVLEIKQLIKKYRIDIVHTNGSADNRIMLYVKMIFRLPFHVVFTKHNPFKINPGISRWRFLFFNDAIIFVSRSIFNHIGFCVNSPKITTIVNGIDISRFYKDASHINQKLTFISNAGTAVYKGWHHLLNAVHLLDATQQENIRIVILGEKPSDEQINALVPHLPNCEIEWTGFTQFPEKYLAKADIGFVLSEFETISFACREMMAAGLPVIVSDTGGLPENVDDGANGWITPTGDVLFLKTLLTTLIAMPRENLKGFSSNARKKAENVFLKEKMLKETWQVYQKIIIDDKIKYRVKKVAYKGTLTT